MLSIDKVERDSLICLIKETIAENFYLNKFSQTDDDEDNFRVSSDWQGKFILTLKKFKIKLLPVHQGRCRRRRRRRLALNMHAKGKELQRG